MLSVLGLPHKDEPLDKTRTKGQLDGPKTQILDPE